MKVKTLFIENFLSKRHFDYGKASALVLVGLCVFMSHLYWNSGFSNLLNANTKDIFENFELWRLFTSLLIHGDMEHLLSNSLMLFILTYFVTSFYGLKISYGLSMIAGALTNLAVLYLNDRQMSIVGISGVVYFLWGFWLCLYLGVQRHLSVIKRLLRVGAVFFILLIPTSYSPQTSYLAHGVGFILGIISALGYFFFFKEKLRSFEKWEVKIDYDEILEGEFENDFMKVD